MMMASGASVGRSLWSYLRFTVHKYTCIYISFDTLIIFPMTTTPLLYTYKYVTVWILCCFCKDYKKNANISAFLITFFE